MTSFWLVWRYLFSGRKVFQLTSLFAIFGVALGVACLVVSMTVVSGFETTLKRAVIDLTGHINLVKRGASISENEVALQDLSTKTPGYVAHAPFLQVEAVVAHQQVIAGVLLEGIEPQSLGKVLKLKDRLMSGELSLQSVDETPGVLIGQGLKRRFGLELGDKFRLILPLPSRTDSQTFRPRLQTFRVNGVLSLGKHDYDERFILADLQVVQKLRGVSGQYTGYKVLIDDDEAAPQVAAALNDRLGYPYLARHWIETNANLLSAVKNEKWVIFFVVLIMVVAACFNVSSHLFVSVLRRYSEISILKTLGASTRLVASVFTIHGLFMGVLGSFLGVALGYLLSLLFSWVQQHWNILPGEVYKLASIQVELRWEDISLTVLATIAVCFLSTLAPALRGARLHPVEGLRYEE